MKRIQKLLVFMCALVATIAIAVPAYAAGGPYTLTIESETSGHTYEAYQIFKGDVSSDGTSLSNVQWGDGVNPSEDNGILADLKSSSAFGRAEQNLFYGCNSAAGVAAVLAGDNFDAELVDAFAEIAGANLVDTEKVNVTYKYKTEASGKYVYEATGLDAGYYLVQDAAGSPSDLQYAKTKFILKVIHDVTAEAKADQPTLDKVILTAGGHEINGDYADAAVGDTVKFQLTSSVPKMDGYNKYFFVVTDELSNGFTLAEDFAKSGVVVKVDGKALMASDYSVVVVNNVVTVSINNLVGKTGEITIEYSATVNDKAVIGNDGNLNTAYLKFSNDPNYTYTDLSDGSAPMGKTPDTKTYTYVGGLLINKVDENDDPITGAQFQIASGDFNQVILIGTTFVKKANGTYYKLKNGTYTTAEPNDENRSDYDSTEIKYALETTTSTETPWQDARVTSWVDDYGHIIVAGLSAGEYTITETVAPDGYNIADPVTVNLEWVAPADATSTACTWKYGTTTADEVKTDDGTSMDLVSVTIKNLRGATLPSTGGMGKTVLITAGAILVIGAGVGLVAKYRANRMK